MRHREALKRARDNLLIAHSRQSWLIDRSTRYPTQISVTVSTATANNGTSQGTLQRKGTEVF